jgi:glycerol-3-phosphate dehydrogenase
MDLYGSRYKDVLKLVEKDPGLKEKVSEMPPVIKAQLVYSVETEMARTVEDITDRRLSLVFRGPLSSKTLSAISAVLPRK